MKKMILTVAMLLTAAGVQAAAVSPTVNFVVTLKNDKSGERLGFLDNVALYWKGKQEGEPQELWLRDAEFSTEDEALIPEVKKCEIKNRENNFIAPESKVIFSGFTLKAYSYRCLTDFEKKHPGKLRFLALTAKLYGELAGKKSSFNVEVYRLVNWQKF